MIRAPLPRAISRCISARSASIPSPSMPRSSIRFAGAPIWLCGSSAMPCASRLRWSMRASMSSSARRSLASSAQRSRQRSTISVRFQSRTFWPKPFSSTARMVSMTWAWGLGMPSSAMSQCTLRSAIMPRSTNSPRTKSRASSMPCASRHLARDGEFDLAGKLRVLADFEGFDIVPKPFAVAPCLRRILRQHHLGMDDAALGGKIVAAIKPLVAQPRARAVGGRRHRAGARLAANDLDVKMIDRHRDQISGTAKRTSERRISAPSLEKFSGGTTPSQAIPAALQHSAGCSITIAPSTAYTAYGGYDAQTSGL